MRVGMADPSSDLTGERPLGWYTGRDSPNTRRLVADYGGFEYDSDYYGDDLPFWMQVQQDRRHAWCRSSSCPTRWTPTTCALRCRRASHAATTSSSYLKDSFDVLYAEGDPDGLNRPKMMSIGMHCRLLGRPGASRALQRFLDHVAAAMTRSGSAGASTSRGTGNRSIPSPTPFEAQHAPDPCPTQRRAARMRPRTARRPVRALALDCRGRAGAAPFCLAGAAEARHGAGAATPPGANAQLALIRAHPELAGKAMVSNTLTAESTNEQSKAGLTNCTPGRVCADPAAQRRLQRQVRLSLHPGGARPARHWA